MRKINYLDILKRALLLTWNNKFLWFFGFLAFLGSLATNVGINIDAIIEKSKDFQPVASYSIQSHPLISLAVGLASIAIILGLFLLRLAATAGITKAANNIAVYRQSTIAAVFSEAKKYVWQLLLLEVLIGVALGVIFIILFIPVSYLFVLKADILATAALLIAALIFAALAVLAYFLRRYAYFYIILGNMKTKMALESAYALFEKNIRESLLMGCIAIVADMVILTIIFVFAVISAAIVIASGLALSLLIAKSGAAVMLMAGAVIEVGFLLVLFSWYASLAQTIWVLFFQQISLEKQPEKKPAEKLETEAIPNPEAV